MDFVDFNLAKKLTEKGFDRPTLFMYDSEGKLPDVLDDVFTKDENVCYRAPNVYEVLKWLREEKNIHIEIRLFTCGYGFDIYKIYPKERMVWSGTLEYETFEQAAIRGIEYTLYNLI